MIVEQGMDINAIKELDLKFDEANNCPDVKTLWDKAIAALKAEAWLPVAEAEKRGAKDGSWVLILVAEDEIENWYEASWDGQDWYCASGRFVKDHEVVAIRLIAERAK